MDQHQPPHQLNQLDTSRINEASLMNLGFTSDMPTAFNGPDGSIWQGMRVFVNKEYISCTMNHRDLGQFVRLMNEINCEDWIHARDHNGGTQFGDSSIFLDHVEGNINHYIVRDDRFEATITDGLMDAFLLTDDIDADEAPCSIAEHFNLRLELHP